MHTTCKKGKTNPTETGYKGLDCIPLAEDNVQRWTPFLRGLFNDAF